MKFELSDSLPIPVSVAERGGEVVLVLRDGAIVDAALVRALNDLALPAEEEPGVDLH